LIKHGYGKVTDQACREIRLGKMNRSQGISMVEKYINTRPVNLSLFLTWLGISENAFYYIVDQFRNPIFWERDDEYKWKYKRLSYGLDKSDFFDETNIDFKDFEITKQGKSSDCSTSYILIGKGAL
jgi:hypothetical protein